MGLTIQTPCKISEKEDGIEIERESNRKLGYIPRVTSEGGRGWKVGGIDGIFLRLLESPPA